jgi:hypothetical protein
LPQDEPLQGTEYATTFSRLAFARISTPDVFPQTPDARRFLASSLAALATRLQAQGTAGRVGELVKTAPVAVTVLGYLAAEKVQLP